MDLDRLKIDRGARGARRARRARGGGIPFLRLTLVAGLVGLGWLFRDRWIDLIDRYRLATVETARAVRPTRAARSAMSGTAANGHVVARVRAALSADTPGRIVELNVVEGERVAEGTVVARLYAEEFEAELARAAAALEAQRSAVGRAEAERVATARDLERSKEESAAASATVDEARADARLAETEVRRIEELVTEGVESESRLDAARRDVDAARARIATGEARARSAAAAVAEAAARLEVSAARVREASAELPVREAERDRAAAALDKTVIRAPFDGIVVLKDAEVGEVVSPNSQAGGSARGAVATMVDFSSLEAQAEVPETSLAAVEVGAPATVFLDAWPERPYRGRVDRIWPTADRQRATVEVRVRFLERDDRLRPEMGLRVVFDAAPDEDVEKDDAPEEDVVLVPGDAVVRAADGPTVFVVERGVVRARRVRVLESRSGRAAIANGLGEGEVVVRAPPVSLEDGDRVVVRAE
ncbi:MAG: efflux RND transporter periplasmic adaptor subunit [Planctomycetota bacterium JB042]